MPARCVDGYEVIRARGERAFQKAIVRFVTNNTQLGQRMAEFATLDYLGNKRWLVAEDIAVLFENRRAGPRFDETSAYKLKHERADVVLRRKCGQLQDTRIKNDSQDTASRAATCARVASLRQIRWLPARSCFSRGSRDGRAQARVKV